MIDPAGRWRAKNHTCPVLSGKRIPFGQQIVIGISIFCKMDPCIKDFFLRNLGLFSVKDTALVFCIMENKRKLHPMPADCTAVIGTFICEQIFVYRSAG